jgi:hypothetical protein
MLNVTHAECHIAAPYAERHSAECRHAKCHSAECRHANCHSAECRHAECRGAVVEEMSSLPFVQTFLLKWRRPVSATPTKQRFIRKIPTTLSPLSLPLSPPSPPLSPTSPSFSSLSLSLGPLNVL